MELDFDKEINALLRQAARSGEFVSTTEQNHLDADKISAFAENALPEKTRTVYVEHFADCDRCRTILSNTILLNQEAGTEAASSVVAAPIAPEIIETKVPWYRKMFLMPNLAYTMGALVLVFGGMIGFSILQNVSKSTSSEVSQIQDKEPRSSGPNASDEGVSYNSNSASAVSNATSNTAMTANSSANTSAANTSNTTTANTSANAPASPPVKAPNESSTADAATEQSDQNLAKQNRENVFVTDGVDDKKAENKEDLAADKNRDLETARSNEAAKTAAAPPPAPKPMTTDSAITQRQVESLQKVAPAKKRSDAKLSENESSRRVSGKIFNRVGGVWIDSAYNKSDSSNMMLPPTRTIRRGSNEYQKLDKQIRIIAESLDGAVIIVWKNGAYRIQ